MKTWFAKADMKEHKGLHIALTLTSLNTFGIEQETLITLPVKGFRTPSHLLNRLIFKTY